MDYPAKLSFKHQASSSRLWALLTIIPLKVLLLIPHFIVLAVVYVIAAVCAVLGILGVLFYGEYPKWCEKWVVGFMRWQWRLQAFVSCFTDQYPPFELEAKGYPAEMSLKHEKENSRLWALLTIIPVKFVIIIPQMVVLFVLQIVAAILTLLGMIATVFVGQFPKNFEGFIVKAYAYQWRLNAYILCLTKEYPPLGLED
ncbi:DUF4389 domain-containing protein [Patescibacteria group bacterium]|nr:DUF4389 domain-containing protein [Patescibacteria group bacterium]